ncbi:MAG: cation diffusion facilitator family transporter [Alphaproteobacteria bacterium]|nr:cation diffusion facilitator family transporter [Alphaproteobacteria bacterium]
MHGHHHGHSHDGHGHDAHANGSGNEWRVGAAALLTGLFMVAEVAGGIVSGSLALLADAGHMLTDFASLGLAWYGFRLAKRPADWKRTYGYDRFSILIAFTNGLALFAIAAWIVAEAWQRIGEPREVMGGLMAAIAIAGLAVNIFAFSILHGGDQDNLNMRAAALHVMGDLLGSVAAIGAAVVILTTGWTPIDPILSVVVALIILRSAWYVVKDSAHILLEGAPAHLDTREIKRDLEAAIAEIDNVHHIHAWSLTEERAMVTLHARVDVSGAKPEEVARRIKARMREKFGIDHATVEVEFEDCADHPLDAGRNGP